MEEKAATETKPARKSKWADRLRGRTQMALLCIGGVCVMGLIGVGNPLSDRITEAQDRLTKAVARAALASDVESLRRQSLLFRGKLPVSVDLNDWTQYLLSAVRSQRVKMVKMD